MLRRRVVEPLLREVRDAKRKRAPQMSSQAGYLTCPVATLQAAATTPDPKQKYG